MSTPADPGAPIGSGGGSAGTAATANHPLAAGSPIGPLRDDQGRPAAGHWSLDASIRHLNHGSFGAVPTKAAQVQQELRCTMHARPVKWFPEQPLMVAQARATVAGWLGIEPDAFAFVANASAGSSVVLNSLALPQGAEILVTDHGYGAVVMGAERVARSVGGRVVVAQVDLDADADAAAAAVISAFTDRTTVVILDQISSPTALRFPVEAICAAAAERGIVSMVDAAHSPLLEASPVGVGADYWFGNLHKFGCAPPGTGVLVPRPGLGDALYPSIDSWGAPYSFPQRFDHQGTVDLTPWLATPAALSEIDARFGWQNVRGYAATLAGWAQRQIADALAGSTGAAGPLQIPLAVGPMRLVALPATLSRTTDEANALRDVCLAELGIEAAFTSFRGRGYLRLSAHAYNTQDDYLDFVERAVPFLDRMSRQPDLVTQLHRAPTGGEQ